MNDTLKLILEILGAAAAGWFAAFIKDVIFKNTLKIKVNTLEKENIELKADVKRLSDNQIGGLRDLVNLTKNVEEMKQTQAKEFQALTDTMSEVSDGLNNLSNVIAQLKGYLEAQKDAKK